MKAIVCEMCTSHDVVKDGEYYVCQNCGTKYTVENAKKLMVEVEGKVDVTGSTVKVDSSDSLANFRELARRAKASGNSENAAKYYEMVAIQDPSDWEASFYSVYYAAASSVLLNMISECNKVSNCIPNVLRLVKSGVAADQQHAVCIEIGNAVRNLRKAFVDTARNHYLKFSTVNGAGTEYNNRAFAAYNMQYAAGSNIFDMFGFKDISLSLLKDCTNYAESHMDAVQLSKTIAKIDPSAGEESLNRQMKRAIRNSIIYIIFAIGFVIAGFVIGSKGEHLSIVKWMCIAFGAGFAIWGIVGIFAAAATKKNFKNGKL